MGYIYTRLLDDSTFPGGAGGKTSKEDTGVRTVFGTLLLALITTQPRLWQVVGHDIVVDGAHKFNQAGDWSALAT